MKRKHRIQATCGQEEQGLSGLQNAPHLQDLIQYHLEDSECWNSKEKFLFVEQPSYPLKSLELHSF
jgi:hypothetical protein